MVVAATETMLRERVESVARTYGTGCTITSFYPPVPPFATDPAGPLVSQLATLSGRAPCSVGFGTEGPFFQQLGMETAIFGPGSIAQAHQPNEYIPLDQISPAVKLLQQLIRHYCLS